MPKMLGMAKKKPETEMNAAPPPPVKKVRHGVPRNFWISQELFDAIEAFRAAQDVRPGETAVFRQALMEFLAKRGFWELDDADGK